MYCKRCQRHTGWAVRFRKGYSISVCACCGKFIKKVLSVKR